MEYKDNNRLKEIKLAIYLNKLKNRHLNRNSVIIYKIFQCLMKAFGEQYLKDFNHIWNLVDDSLFGASDEEIAAIGKLFFPKYKLARLLVTSPNKIYSKYVIHYDKITQEFLDSIQPVFIKEEEIFVINALINFIEKFRWELGKDFVSTEPSRDLEIEFYMIYRYIMEIIQNTLAIDNFFKNICEEFDIRFSVIFNMRNNIHFITRAFPASKYGNRWFMQELVYYYSKRGLSKGAIGSKVLKKGTNYLYNNTNKKFNYLLGDASLTYFYDRVMKWDADSMFDARKFIELIHKVVSYEY